VAEALSQRSKDCADATLKLLWPPVATLQPGPMVSLGVQKDLHIMMSYCWDVQETIKRIVSELQNRGYICWLDIEQMKGSVSEAMSAAVEDAEVMLYSVCQSYKESANCRLEANYGMQQEVDQIPLMVQESFKATGWLGLILGTRLWYQFWESAIATPQAFTQRMDALCREIGDRGKPKSPKTRAAPPSRTESTPVLAPAPTHATAAAQEISTGLAPAGGVIELIMAESREVRRQAEADRAAMKADVHRLVALHREEIAAQSPKEVVAPEQLATVQARLEGLRAAKMLSDEEFFALEDSVGDCIELSASVGLITHEMVFGHHAGTPSPRFGIVAKVHTIVRLSSDMVSDAGFARQLRRKFM
jgi:hypothetical protein